MGEDANAKVIAALKGILQTPGILLIFLLVQD